MNDECLKLRNEPTGAQTDAEIHSIVMQAIGTKNRNSNFEEDDDYIDDAIVSSFSRSLIRWYEGGR